ncbi:hypothetical protein ANN_03313 [Periplaneta americana]|uniref:Tc1-like transposase DDE domain-containing protein n=1 Tax=Periplaneta americana TaxID=6978 RepID=A0ABQ8U2R6_PERAM|nr:hypothetical protein ANN_03313 [Periplaneta americana]
MLRLVRTIVDFRREGRSIFYLDESWVDSNLTFQKCWQGPEVTGICADGNAADRLIMVHVGPRPGFLNNASLVYKAGTTDGDYHGQMNSGNFGKWVWENLLTSLPPNSVVVLDNAPYHNVQVDKPPTKNTVKSDMVSWLQRQGVVCDISMRKDQFPIELAWAKVKRYVRENNVSGDMSLSRLKELTRLGIESVTTDDWEGYCNHVESLEKRYWDRDGLVSDLVDSIIIENPNGDKNSSCDKNSSVSEDDHHSYSDSGDDSSDSELARPL